MSEPRRLFTLARANKALPLVERIVNDVVARETEMQSLTSERKTARREALETIERKLFDLEGDLERLTQELATIGCELKDRMRGLVDFPSRLGDRPIYLCWMKGEPRIEWWHPIETGIAGRRPTSELPPEASTR